MPLPVIANVFRVAVNWRAGESPLTFHNVMHFRSPGATPEDVATAFDNHKTTGMWRTVSQTYSVDSLDVTKLDGSSVSFHFDTGSDTDWDGQGGTQFIPQASAIVKLATALRGRSYRGRIYLPALAEDRTFNGVVDPTDQGITTAAWDTFGTDMIAAGTTLVVASYKHATAADVTNIICESRTGTQRRRQPRS
jgi:hypothetical protein